MDSFTLLSRHSAGSGITPSLINNIQAAVRKLNTSISQWRPGINPGAICDGKIWAGFSSNTSKFHMSVIIPLIFHAHLSSVQHIIMTVLQIIV
jgi:hypothetical protein